MADINEPNYVHYTRINSISFDEAKKLLASFELRVRNIADPNEYERLLNEEMSLAYKVLFEAFDSGALIPYYDGPACDVSESGLKGDYYYLDQIRISTVKFCSWASKLNYNLPEILQKCKKDSHGNEERKSAKIAPEPNLTDTKNKSGKPKGYLKEAIEHAYLKYYNEGNTEILRENNIREFVKRLKELADEKGNLNFSQHIADRIDSIKISPSGYTIKTKDKYIEASNTREIIDKGRNFGLQRVSQILVELRVKYPLPK